MTSIMTIIKLLSFVAMLGILQNYGLYVLSFLSDFPFSYDYIVLNILLSFSQQVNRFYHYIDLTEFLLIFFVDDESQSSSICSGLAAKRAYIPRRLMIGNDEYVYCSFSLALIISFMVVSNFIYVGSPV